MGYYTTVWTEKFHIHPDDEAACNQALKDMGTTESNFQFENGKLECDDWSDKFHDLDTFVSTLARFRVNGVVSMRGEDEDDYSKVRFADGKATNLECEWVDPSVSLVRRLLQEYPSLSPHLVKELEALDQAILLTKKVGGA